MSGSGSVAASTENAPETLEIDSRFGRITVRPAQAILFPNGLLGMPGQMPFCLARFPSEKMARFSILQSLSDHSLAFITLPIDSDNPLIEREDIETAARDLSVPLDDLVILLVVSVRREGSAVKLTVNARAPIFVRLSLKVAAQYVFPNTRYDIRQPLSL